MSSTVIIGNKKICVSGNNVSIIGDKVFVDGKEVNIDKDSTENGILKIEVTGTLNSIESDVSVEVKGNVLGNVEAGNYVTAEDIGGNAEAGNYIRCSKVAGNATAGNYVRGI